MIEFNELTPRLLDAWMASGDLPNFKRFHDRSQVFITEADDFDPVNLEPWIQWYSIHTGLPFQQHGVFHLTDGPRAGHPDVWSILHSHGKRVWNCASMNARGFSYRGSAFLPDPWCTTEPAHPEELTAFQRFVAYHVQEHARPENGLGLRNNARFAAFMATHGLQFSTASAITRQLFSEITSSGKHQMAACLVARQTPVRCLPTLLSPASARLLQLLRQQHGTPPARILAAHGARRVHRAAFCYGGRQA